MMFFSDHGALAAVKFSPRHLAKPLVGVGVLLLIGACQSPSPSTEISAHNSIQALAPENEHEPVLTLSPETKPQSRLTAELLYDILVASIAAQRNRPAVALEALSSAAYHSEDRRLISEAIQLAMDLEQYQQAIALAEFFNRLQPDNHRAILVLAKAQFKLGEAQKALSALIDLAKNQTTPEAFSDASVLQDIAALLSAQDQKTVLPEFMQQVEKNPDNAQLALTAALLASRLGNADEFIRLLDKTLELKSDWEFPGTLKLSELSTLNLDSMTRFAEHYLTANPQHEKFKLQYARLLIQQDDIDGALGRLKEILALNPDSVDALFRIGVIYLDQDLLEESKKALQRYLELNPTNNQNWPKTDLSRIYLADIEFKLKHYAAAALYLHGVSSPRYYLDAQVKMARVIAQRDDLDSALNHLQQIVTANDAQRTRIILEQDALLREHNQLHRSRLLLDEGLEEFPDQPDLLYNRGLLAAQMELLELHEQDMRKLITLQPDNAHAYNALGYTLADQTDRLSEAMALIVKANELLPDDGFILDSMGWVYFRLGDNEQAIKFLRQAMAIRQDAEIAAHLGEALWVAGHQDEAIKIWRQGTEWGPENVILKNTIARFSQQQ